MASPRNPSPAALLFGLLLVALFLTDAAFGHGDHGVGPSFVHREAHLLPLPDQAIALVALAIAFARLEADSGAEPLWTLALAIVGGVLAGARFSFSFGEIARAIPLLVIGVLLIDPREKSKGLPRTSIAVAGVSLGFSYGATLAPDFNYFVHTGFFLSIAVMTAVVSVALWKRVYQPWFGIAVKIVGSWMTAIGTILLGAALR